MIGFDIGTTQSKVAYVDPAGKAVAIFNTRKEPQTPSAVYYSPSGEIIVGTEAIEQGYINPERCVRNFKLKLGTTESLIPGGSVITPTNATADVIRFLKEIAERHLARAINEAVATAPSNSKDDFKQALIEAFEQNGIKILKLVPEPTAAGLAYTCDKAASAMTVAVYDFGGGTFDISILKVEGSEITVLATDGVQKLGGNDLNECLRRRVLDAFEAKFRIRPSIQAEPLLYLDLDQRVERAKISLNTRPEVPIVLGYQGNQLIVFVELTASSRRGAAAA